MAMALRPRESPSSMASRCTAHALADGCGGAVFAANSAPKSVVTSMAGFAGAGSTTTALTASAGAAPVVTSASGWTSREATGVANAIRKDLEESPRCGHLRAKVGGHPYGRFCGRWPAIGATGGARFIGWVFRPTSPQTFGGGGL